MAGVSSSVNFHFDYLYERSYQLGALWIDFRHTAP